MPGPRHDVIQYLDAAAEAVGALRALTTLGGDLDDVLLHVARNAVQAVSAADAVSITVLADPAPRTAAHTDEGVLPLDREQYATGRGPCLEAAHTRRLVHAPLGGEEHRWPEFAAAARSTGMRAVLSIPLIIGSDDTPGEDELAGSLNVYSQSVEAFDPVDQKLLALYTDAAGQAVTHARHQRRTRDLVAQLEQAMVSRSEIDQAKGALRVLHGGTAEEAFASLVERSQRENVKVRDIARRILEDLSRRLR